MSATDQEPPSRGGSFHPTKIDIDEWKRISLFFRDFLADEPFIKYSIIAAGVAGVLESLHIVWLALRYVFRF